MDASLIRLTIVVLGVICGVAVAGVVFLACHQIQVPDILALIAANISGTLSGILIIPRGNGAKPPA